MAMKKRKNTLSGSSGIIVAMVIAVCFVLLLRGVSLMRKGQNLAQREVVLAQQIEEAKQEQKELEKKEKYMQTDEYIEEIARERLGLANPNEILFKPAEEQ
jgi:cell division protein DivIC